MPHLILARTKTENDASNNKSIARRLAQWINWDRDFLFLEAKANQERMSRTKKQKQSNLLMNKKNLINTCQQEKLPMPFRVLQKTRKVVSFL